MLGEINLASRFLGAKFGRGNDVPDGVYAVPYDAHNGKAFMKLEVKNGQPSGRENYMLYWDEELTISWYNQPKPLISKESKFSKRFRLLMKA